MTNTFFLKSPDFFTRIKALDPDATISSGSKVEHTHCCACSDCGLNSTYHYDGFIVDTTVSRSTLKKNKIFVSATALDIYL